MNSFCDYSQAPHPTPPQLYHALLGATNTDSTSHGYLLLITITIIWWNRNRVPTYCVFPSFPCLAFWV